MIYNFHTLMYPLFGWLAFALSILAGAPSSALASASVKVEWNANTEPDLQGYRVRMGTASGVYTSTLEVGNATTTSVANLDEGQTYYFVVIAYDAALQESRPSAEVAVTIPYSALTFGGTFTGSAVSTGTELSAFVEVRMLKTRQFTGRVIIGNVSKPIAGTVNSLGRATVIPPLPFPQNWRFIFQMNPGNTSMTVQLVLGETTLPVSLDSTPFSTMNVTQQAGTYTARFGALATENETLAPRPERGGFARIAVTSEGRVKTSGRLVDGTAFSFSSYLGENGKVLVHTPLYRNPRGILAGSLFLRETVGLSDGDGNLTWRRPGLRTAALFPGGFDGTVPVEISRFQKYVTLQTANSGNSEPAAAALRNGDLPGENASLFRGLAFPNGNFVTVIGAASEKLVIRISPSTGLISGSFIHPADGKTRTLSGVVFQKQSSGGGFFRGVSQIGQLDLARLPVPPSL